jgi:hypothetical protein
LTIDPFKLFQDLAPGLPVLGSCPTPHKVRRDARQLATELSNGCANLKKIAERHKETIRTIWSKKFNTQKKRLLLEV